MILFILLPKRSLPNEVCATYMQRQLEVQMEFNKLGIKNFSRYMHHSRKG